MGVPPTFWFCVGAVFMIASLFHEGIESNNLMTMGCTFIILSGVARLEKHLLNNNKDGDQQ